MRPLLLLRSIGIILIVAPLFIAASALAQNKLIENFEVYVGLGPIKNAGVGATYDRPKTSYSFGAGATHSFSDQFDLNFRLGYELKGFKVADTGFNISSSQYETTEVERNINCITLAIIPTINIGEKNKLKLGLGPYVSFPYHSTETKTIRGPAGNIISSGDTPVSGDVTTDFGAQIAIGYYIPFKNQHGITAQITNGYGLVTYTNALRREVTNNITAFVLSYQFAKKS